MSTTIEQLELDVQSNSTSAVSGIDALSESLRRLKAATAPVSKGGVGLGALSNSLKKFNQGVAGLNGLTLAKEQVEGLVEALKPLESIQKSGFNSMASGLDKLVKVAPQLDTVTKSLKNTDLDSFAEQCNRVAIAITPLAIQMEKVSAGFSAFPAKIQSLLKNNASLAASNTALSKSYVNLAAKASLAYIGLRRVVNVISGWITSANQYIEDMNLFTVSMGQYVEESSQYAEQVGEIMGINPGDWMRNQGVFMTITEGFGVASDRAYTMSKNLTQLTYDLASFFNISTSDAFQKLESGISGELEPLRRLGYDLSVARLQQEAYNLGIDKSVTSMTQAEKAELRYYAIMTQVTTAQGDMARTLDAPANQLRILQAQIEQATRALGNLFLPVLKAILPYAIALAKAIRLVAEVIADFFNVSIPDFDTGSGAIDGVVNGADDAADGLDDAANKAKKLKNALLGIDELNVISPSDDSAADSDSTDGVGGGGLGFDLPTYDFISDAVNEQVDEIMNKIQPFIDWVRENIAEILANVIAIGTEFLAWKIAKGVRDFLQWLSTMKGFNIVGSIGFKIAGLGLFLDSWNTMKKAIQDILENGPNFTNVTKLISGFAEGLGAAFLLFGNLKIAGVMLVISGLSGMVSAISEMFGDGGINWDNAMLFVKNLGLFISGLGLLSGNTQLGGIGLIISGTTLIVDNLKGLIEAIQTGDWSGVDAIEIATGALMVVGGFILALKKLDALKDSGTAGQVAKEALDKVTDTTSKLDTTISTGLSPKLTSLTKNLGLGLVVIGEVAAAALLIVGAIALMGMELEQVAIAWEPVIANGGTVATAIGIGTGILAAVGLVAYALGTGGKSIAINIGLGTAILLELGIAAGLFIVEIWAIGKGLDEIGIAWEPVLNNGGEIATAIGIGTGLLIGIGVVTAALGAATVATAGLLPAAIGLGTALLVALSEALLLFIDSLVDVANKLGDDLAPALSDLNEKLPDLTDDMSDFVDFMCDFAGEVVRYSGASTVSGLAATIDTIVGWFTQDPIEKMSSDVNNIAGQASDLNDKLNVAIPELETAVDLLTEYVDFIDQLGTVADSDGVTNLSEGLKVNLYTVGQDIVIGFNDGIESEYYTIQSTITNWGSDSQKWFNDSSYGNVNKEKWQTFANDIINGFKDKISSNYSDSKNSVTTWARDIKNWFTQTSHGSINREKFSNYAKTIIDGFSGRILIYKSESKAAIVAWASNIKNWFERNIDFESFYNIAKDVVNGFNKGIGSYYNTTEYYMKQWAKDAEEAYKAELDSHSPSRVFEKIGKDTVLGYNLGIVKQGKTTTSVVTSWADSFTNVNPVIKFAVDTSNLKYYTSDSFVREISSDVVGNKSYVVNNDNQVVESISAGVSVANDGVVAAIYALMNLIDNKDFSVSIGDDTIGHSYDRYNQKRGVRVNTGAFSNAY